MIGFWMNRLRNGRKAVLRNETERRLVVGGPSEPGDFIECYGCKERFEFDPERPEETSFPRRLADWHDHVRLMHPEDKLD